MQANLSSFIQILGINNKQDQAFYEEIEKCTNETEVIRTLANERFSEQLKDLETRQLSPATRLFKAAHLYQQNDLLTISVEGKNFYVSKKMIVAQAPTIADIIKGPFSENNENAIHLNLFKADIVECALKLMELIADGHLTEEAFLSNKRDAYTDIRKLHDCMQSLLENSKEPSSSQETLNNFWDFCGSTRPLNVTTIYDALKRRMKLEELRQVTPDRYQELFNDLPDDQSILNSLIKLVELEPHNVPLKELLGDWFLNSEKWERGAVKRENGAIETVMRLNKAAKEANLEKLEMLTSFLIDAYQMCGLGKLDVCVNFTKPCSYSGFSYITEYSPESKNVEEMFNKHAIPTIVTPELTPWEENCYKLLIQIPWVGPSPNPVVELMRRVFLELFIHDVQEILDRPKNGDHFKDFQTIACHKYFENDQLSEELFESINEAFQAQGIQVDLFPLDGKSISNGVCLTFSKSNVNWDSSMTPPEVIRAPHHCPEKVLFEQPEGSWFLQPTYDLNTPVYTLYVKSSDKYVERKNLPVQKLQGKTSAEIISLIYST